jgi:hypothetical protein
MKKLLLIGGLTLCLGVTTKAQKLIVYDNWQEIHNINYYTSNATYPSSFKNPHPDGINKSDTVAKFVRTANDSKGVPSKYTLISGGTKIPGSGNWGTFNMSTNPVISMDVYAEDSMTVRILVKDKVTAGNPDITHQDFLYSVTDKGHWRRLIADFSTIAGPDWPATVELQLYFSYGVAKDITAYFDNIDGAATVADVPTGVRNIENAAFEMQQNVPNPASDITHLGYSLQNSEKVSLKVYDILGNCVAALVNEKQAAGKYNVSFDVTGLQNGIYYSTLQVGAVTQTKKLQVIR